MKLKLVLGTLIALVTLGVAGGVAFAADSSQRQGGIGKVIAIEGDTIVVENFWGTFDVLTDEETVFRVRGIENPTIKDVNVGDIVAGRIEKGEDGTFLAKLVAVIPPGAIKRRGLGKVTAVGKDSITIKRRNGESVTVHVNDETLFRIRGVENPGLEDIQVGDIVAGKALKQEDDTLLAKLIIVVPPKEERVRGLGRVTAVGEDSLTVERHNGESVTIYVDDETLFRIRGIEDPGLEDIQVGDIVAGKVVKQEEGTLLAKLIIVVPPKEERVRGLGKVTAVGEDSLTVERRNGESVTLYVDDETLFRIRGIENPTIEDVQVGDLLAGTALRQEDGTLLAKLIIVLPFRPQGPS
jgi:exosome complex RNA-binding protein Csl4